MRYLDLFTQLFTITFSVLAALVLAFYIIWPKIENHMFRMHAIQERTGLAKDKLQLRFAAYERLLLLIHRISPQQVMLRNHDGQNDIGQFKQNLMADIDSEFQHNFTQQLYVSDASWLVIKDLKESTIKLFKNASIGLADNAQVDDYITIVLKHLKGLEINPYEAAQIILKKELSA